MSSSLSSDPLLSSLNLFRSTNNNRKSSSPLIMMGSIGGGLLIELLRSGMMSNRSYSVPSNNINSKGIKTTTPNLSTTTTNHNNSNNSSSTQIINNSASVASPSSEGVRTGQPTTTTKIKHHHNNNTRVVAVTSEKTAQQKKVPSFPTTNIVGGNSNEIATPKLKSLSMTVSNKSSAKEIEEMKQEEKRHKQRWTETQFMLTSIHEIDTYLIKNKFQISKEEAIHEFFKMMKFVLAYSEATQSIATKKMIGMVYSISKNVLKIIGNNPQSLRDIYNLLCMIQFKNYTSLQIPCYQLAYGFRALNDIEFAQSLFDNHILFILETLLKKNQSFYCDYLMSAHLLLPVFSISHEDLVDKILEISARVIPKGALGASSEEVHERFKDQTKVLPSHNSYGLFSCVRSLSDQLFQYMESIEKKTTSSGGKFDSDLFIKSVRKIHEKGIHMDIHKYNFALQILVRNNSTQTLEFFEELRKLEHITPDTGTYCTLIKYYGKKMSEDDEQSLLSIYDEIKKKNLINQHLLTTFLSITKRHCQFDTLREKVSADLLGMKNLDSHSITELIHQSVLQGGITAGYSYFCSARETAKLNGITLSSSAYNIILHAVSNDLKQVTLAFNILNCMLEDKVHPSDFVLVSLLGIETKLRDLLYKPGEVDNEIVERLERYKHTLDLLLRDMVEDACQGKQVNYVIISAAMKRFKATKEYSTVIKIWNAVRSTLSQKSKLDGSIYLIAFSSCELCGDFKAFNDSLEFFMKENLPRISWQLYYYLISKLISQKKVQLGDSALYERLLKFVFEKYTPLVCDVKNIQRIIPDVVEDRWAIPPPSITALEIKLLELAKKFQLLNITTTTTSL